MPPAFGQYMNQHQQAAPADLGVGQSTQNPQDFFRFQSVSPEMLNFGLSASQDILNQQREKYLPGVSGFWSSLKVYFSVSILIAKHQA
jgi:hypothetical protein